jgi:starch synthase
VIGALPAALARLEESTAIFLPAYTRILEGQFQLENLGVDVEVPTASESIRGRLLRTVLPGSGVPVFLFHAEKLFGRAELYGEEGKEYPDNPLRFGVFARAALEAARVLNWNVEIVHAHDWQAALVPVFLRTHYADDPRFERTRSVLTVHNLAYQGWSPPEILTELHLSESLLDHHFLECHGMVNFLKGGIVFADQITTVSPRYAEEILQPEEGWGLEEALKAQSDNLTGVLNGVDPDVWSPAIDPHLTARYSIENWAHGKATARRELLTTFGLDPDGRAPLVGFIGRLTGQKGVDFLLGSVRSLVKAGGRLVLIGTGDPRLERAWRKVAARYPGTVGVIISYNEPLAHLIQAGSDMLVMPSRFEPCGLNQLYAMRYGTVPVVNPVGGLLDTVVPATAANLDAETATGFHLDALSRQGIADTLRRAFALFEDGERWKALVEAGMRQDFTWERSARTYRDLYSRVLDRTHRHMPFKMLPQFPRPAAVSEVEENGPRPPEELPPSYGEPVLTLMVQGPMLVFAYWEIPATLRGAFGSSPRLELEDLDSGERQVVSLAHEHEFGDYWFHVEAEHAFQARIVSGDGSRPHLVSERVTTPRTRPSPLLATADSSRPISAEELPAHEREPFIEQHARLLGLMGVRWRPDVSGLPVPLESLRGLRPPSPDESEQPDLLDSIPSSMDSPSSSAPPSRPENPGDGWR